MNCLNGARYLRDAINSVFSQTYANWEIVFWDNGSSDESGVIARSYGEKVRYFRSDFTTGLGVARNKALEKCCGEYIAFLDVDDIWLPEKLERQVALLESNQNLGLVYSDSIFFDERGDRYKLFEIVTPKKGKVFGDLLERNFMQTVTMIYRTKALNTLPYAFDREITMAMDYDLSLRLAYFFELDYVENALSKWRMHSGNESTKRRFLMPKENQIIIEKLCRELPDINVKYRKQVNNFIKSFVHRQLAFEQWDRGNRAGARIYLFPYLKEPKYLFTYLCTYLLTFKIFDKMKAVLINKMSWYIRR
jgi:glycosyltransferase involved in cell wall biosynthesis